jgi:2-polyprenyl-3-methyl-5-hydroxy-6-metoxy-1,4-benzoquinol methylase
MTPLDDAGKMTSRVSRSKCAGRLRAVFDNCDLRGATVLDLGCNAGYFTFPMADVASRVIAIDGDPRLIHDNKERARAADARNISFVHAVITPELILSDAIPRRSARFA